MPKPKSKPRLFHIFNYFFLSPWFTIGFDFKSDGSNWDWRDIWDRIVVLILNTSLSPGCGHGGFGRRYFTRENVPRAAPNLTRLRLVRFGASLGTFSLVKYRRPNPPRATQIPLGFASWYLSRPRGIWLKSYSGDSNTTRLRLVVFESPS